MTTRVPTQCERLAKYLEEFGTITQLEALRDLGIMRLASRVNDLRKEGWQIRTDMIPVRNRWGQRVEVAQYRMETEQEKDERIMSLFG